jgi:hypothetical protein
MPTSRCRTCSSVDSYYRHNHTETIWLGAYLRARGWIKEPTKKEFWHYQLQVQ